MKNTGNPPKKIFAKKSYDHKDQTSSIMFFNVRFMSI